LAIDATPASAWLATVMNSTLKPLIQAAKTINNRAKAILR